MLLEILLVVIAVGSRLMGKKREVEDSLDIETRHRL